MDIEFPQNAIVDLPWSATLLDQLAYPLESEGLATAIERLGQAVGVWDQPIPWRELRLGLGPARRLADAHRQCPRSEFLDLAFQASFIWRSDVARGFIPG